MLAAKASNKDQIGGDLGARGPNAGYYQRKQLELLYFPPAWNLAGLESCIAGDLWAARRCRSWLSGWGNLDFRWNSEC